MLQKASFWKFEFDYKDNNQIRRLIHGQFRPQKMRLLWW